MLIPLCFVVGLAIYFLVIVAKFYKKLSSGIISGQQPGIGLQTYSSPRGVLQGGGVFPVYTMPATQNITYAYQQEPATNPYQQHDYANPDKDHGVKGQHSALL